jgi:cytochrome c-type biogenesis protein CcmH/NrfF
MPVVAAAAPPTHRKMTVLMAMPMTVLVLVTGFVGKAMKKPSGKHIQILTMDWKRE